MSDGPPRTSALFAREGDTGLQHERTSLAWTRTGMAFIIVGGLLMRSARRMVVPGVGYALGLIVLAIAAALLAGVQERYLRREARLHAGAEGEAAHAGALRGLALVSTATSLAAATGVLLLLV